MTTQVMPSGQYLQPSKLGGGFKFKHKPPATQKYLPPVMKKLTKPHLIQNKVTADDVKQLYQDVISNTPGKKGACIQKGGIDFTRDLLKLEMANIEMRNTVNNIYLLKINSSHISPGRLSPKKECTSNLKLRSSFNDVVQSVKPDNILLINNQCLAALADTSLNQSKKQRPKSSRPNTIQRSTRMEKYLSDDSKDPDQFGTIPPKSLPRSTSNHSGLHKIKSASSKLGKTVAFSRSTSNNNDLEHIVDVHEFKASAFDKQSRNQIPNSLSPLILQEPSNLSFTKQRPFSQEATNTHVLHQHISNREDQFDQGLPSQTITEEVKQTLMESLEIVETTMNKHFQFSQEKGFFQNVASHPILQSFTNYTTQAQRHAIEAKIWEQLSGAKLEEFKNAQNQMRQIMSNIAVDSKNQTYQSDTSVPANQDQLQEGYGDQVINLCDLNESKTIEEGLQSIQFKARLFLRDTTAQANKLTRGALSRNETSAKNRSAVSAGFNRVKSAVQVKKNITLNEKSNFIFNTQKQQLRGDPVKLSFTMSQMMLSPQSLTQANLINNTIRLVESAKDVVPEVEVKTEPKQSVEQVTKKIRAPPMNKIIIPNSKIITVATVRNSTQIDDSNIQTKREGLTSERQHKKRMQEIVINNLPTSTKKKNADLPLGLDKNMLIRTQSPASYQEKEMYPPMKPVSTPRIFVQNKPRLEHESTAHVHKSQVDPSLLRSLDQIKIKNSCEININTQKFLKEGGIDSHNILKSSQTNTKIASSPVRQSASKQQQMTFTQNINQLARCLDKQTPEQNLSMAKMYTRDLKRRKAPQASHPVQSVKDSIEETRQLEYVRNTLGWTSCSGQEPKEPKRQRYEGRVKTATVKVNQNVLQKLLFSDSKGIEAMQQLGSFNSLPLPDPNNRQNKRPGTTKQVKQRVALLQYPQRQYNSNRESATFSQARIPLPVKDLHLVIQSSEFCREDQGLQLQLPLTQKSRQVIKRMESEGRFTIARKTFTNSTARQSNLFIN